MPLAPQETRTYFITTIAASRRSLFQTERNAQLLIEILQIQRAKQTFCLHAFVLMPNHVHILFTPAPFISLEKTMQLIKGGFSFRLKSRLDVWERSYDSRRITDTESFEARLNYIHENPVRANLSLNPTGYPYSSAALPHLTDPAPPHFRR